MHRFMAFWAGVAAVELISLAVMYVFHRRSWLWKFYLAVHIPLWLGMAVLWVVPWNEWPPGLRSGFFTLWILLLLPKPIWWLFHAGHALWEWMHRWWAPRRKAPEERPSPPRRQALRVITAAAMGAPALPTMAGVLLTPSALRLRRHTFPFPDIPEPFDGFRVAHISDLHLGTFRTPAIVRRMVDAIHSARPDVILFTGDLVNYKADEVIPYIKLLSTLRAPWGVWAVLGNHDYGLYYPWKTDALRRANFQRLLKVYERLGWRLLRNEHAVLRKGDAALALIGLENWNRRGIQRADWAQATRYLPDEAFRILMAHDPHYFEDFILGKIPVQLTLSGHTHGFQMGVETRRFRWSPAQYLYRFWAGPYQWPGQALYVHRGVGMVGLPFRIGIWPEVALITLRKKSSHHL